MHLSARPEMQKKVREEVQHAKAKAATEGRSELSHEEVSSLSYMDAVVVRLPKQRLRLRYSVSLSSERNTQICSSSVRMASQAVCSILIYLSQIYEYPVCSARRCHTA